MGVNRVEQTLEVNSILPAEIARSVAKEIIAMFAANKLIRVAGGQRQPHHLAIWRPCFAARYNQGLDLAELRGVDADETLR